MVILNQVPDDALAFIDETVRPCLKSQAMPIVREVVAILQADILTRDYNPDPVCERFTIGVMSAGAALARFHRQKKRAASTAGARADNKLAPP